MAQEERHNNEATRGYVGQRRRWASKANKQLRLLDDEKMQFESEVDNELESAFRTSNLTLALICLMASHTYNRRNRLSANKSILVENGAERL